jgi:hypothetical protein
MSGAWRWLRKGVLGLLGLAATVLCLAFAFPPHKDVLTTIVIAAPPQKVWSVLADTAAYPTWNPEISALIGPLAQGAVLENHEGAGDGQMVFHPVVLAAEPGRELRWLGTLGFARALSAEHYFLLRPSSGGTDFTQGEHLSGALLWLWDARQLEPGFAAMNTALKRRVEAAERGKRSSP